MQKIIFFILLILFAPIKNYGQSHISSDILLKVIQNRNNYSDLTAQVAYNIKNFGDNRLSEMEYSVNLLRDDSFYLDVSKRGNFGSKIIMYEYADSSHMLSEYVKNQTFVLYGIKKRNNKRNSYFTSILN